MQEAHTTFECGHKTLHSKSKHQHNNIVDIYKECIFMCHDYESVSVICKHVFFYIRDYWFYTIPILLIGDTYYHDFPCIKLLLFSKAQLSSYFCMIQWHLPFLSHFLSLCLSSLWHHWMDQTQHPMWCPQHIVLSMSLHKDWIYQIVSLK